MKVLLILLLLPSILFAQSDTTQKIIADRSNSVEQQKKPYVILISADGFRYDLADKYNAENLKRLRSNGIAAASMKPSFPSLTFPNHYTIATGLYPSHHGLVDNTFYDKKKDITYSIGNRKAVADSSFYGGTPLWVLAEKQHMISASFYWVGSETAVQGVRPTYYYLYNTDIDIDTRINVVKNWLTLPEEKRPHLITFYLPEVDHEEHLHGIESKEALDAVQFVDNAIGKMVRTLDSLQLPINYIFLSDHGMVEIDTVNSIPLPPAIDTTKFVVPNGDVILHLYAKDKNDVKPTYEALKQQAKDFAVYLPDETRKAWHYSSKDDLHDRIGDIVLIPAFPKIFNIKNRKKLMPGYHGFDNDMPQMQATFYAWGPAFKQHLIIPSFENVNVYPFIANILGLKITDKIDGNFKVLKNTLAK
ncbi:ectonucleotide pyrophosphatase/phosphodiesterase [Danxiaibacter flavus]|uniref:Ectonucleotide pyrophosphatase/phosphodiesterase n=1 Tax=Danxiaibacter flavus TaxID=3049108 RepID=A0ABV3ZE21_9BACT|nr:ectonucleotide pyrophosphatase/phosphodiesterase [Chitinophagaceae bacterium DXS]